MRPDLLIFQLLRLIQAQFAGHENCVDNSSNAPPNEFIPLPKESEMKKLPSLMLLSLALSSPLVHATDSTPAAAPQTPTAPAFKAHVLNRAELDALLATPDKVLLIDVRRPDEVTNIGGFPVYLSIQFKDLEKSLAYIPKDRAIVLVSNHAGRAGKAADLLTEKGYNVAGAAGVEGYAAQGGLVTKIAPSVPAQAHVQNTQTGSKTE